MAGPRALRLLPLGGLPTARIEAFSDGVFAIVSTLLVLSVHVPHVRRDVAHELPHALLRVTPHFLSFALSFGIVCVWWVAHHSLFHLLAKSDRGLLWLNS